MFVVEFLILQEIMARNNSLDGVFMGYYQFISELPRRKGRGSSLCLNYKYEFALLYNLLRAESGFSMPIYYSLVILLVSLFTFFIIHFPSLTYRVQLMINVVSCTSQYA